jgi:hypothetical protein
MEAHLISTTATIPVSFATTSTVQAVSAPGTGSTVESHLISTTATIPVSFATTSTVQVSGTISQVTKLAGTSDVRLAVDALNLMKTTGGTVSILATTSTVPVSFAPSSTVQAAPGGTQDVRIVTSAVMIPTDVQAVYQSAVTLWSSTNITSTATWINSAAVDISTFVTKTCALFPTFSGTMRIQTTPTSSTTTWYDFYTGNITANSYFKYTFTDAQYWARIGINASATGTLDGWVIRQVG